MKGKGCEKIISGLQNDGTLKKLDLSYNGVQDEGAVLIAEVIAARKISALVELALAGNNITSRGFTAILDSLGEKSSSLQTVRLDQNYISEDQFSPNKCKDGPVQVHFSKSVLKLGFSNLRYDSLATREE